MYIITITITITYILLIIHTITITLLILLFILLILLLIVFTLHFLLYIFSRPVSDYTAGCDIKFFLYECDTGRQSEVEASAPLSSLRWGCLVSGLIVGPSAGAAALSSVLVRT